MQSHSSVSPLATQLRQLVVGDGHIALWALGQHGFLLKAANTVILIDPYLSNAIEEASSDAPGTATRLIPIVVSPTELDMVDIVLITHHHADHCDPQTLRPLLATAPHARVIASYKARDTLATENINITRFEVPPVDQAVHYSNDLSITAIPAAHYDHELDAVGNPAYLGFIITLNGVTLYHSGDTVIYPGLVERLQQQPIDLMCLPINGRDWFREQQGLVGNMDYREAADLTAQVGAHVLIPAHNDLFERNRINPAYLLDYLTSHYPQQRVHFLQPGELYYYIAS